MLHDVVVGLFWVGEDPIGQDEYRDRALLGSAAGRPFQTALRKDIHRTVHHKAAALFHALISNHPFYNGNKRAAVLALEHFLLANGYFLLVTNDQMYRLAEETARYREKGIGHEEVLASLLRRIRESSAPLRKLKSQTSASLYADFLAAKRQIRKHELNRPAG